MSLALAKESAHVQLSDAAVAALWSSVGDLPQGLGLG